MKRNFLILLFSVMSLIFFRGAAISDSEAIPEPVAANPMKPADPALLSKPLDPWSIEPVRVDTMYLVLPFLWEGKTGGLGTTLMTEAQEGLIPCLSRDMGITRSGYTREMIKSMSDYSNNTDVVELTDSVVKDVIKFSHPSHVISGSYTVKDGRLIVSVQVEEGKNKWTKNFDLPENHLFQFRRDIVQWMVECGALKVKDERARALSGMLPYGEGVMTYGDKLYGEMTSDPHHQEWDALIKMYGENDYHQFLRMCAAVKAKDMEMVKKLTPGPLGEKAAFFERLARKQSLKYQQKLDAASHELELVIAVYPGIFGQANAYFNYTFSEGQKREEFVHAVEEWCKRVSQYPLANVMAGEAMRDAAWDYRGTGFANTVTPTAWKKFDEFGRKGIVFLEAAMKCGIPEPNAVHHLMTLKMAVERNHEEAMKLHRRTCTRYPDEHDTWFTIMEFTRPRWGGTHQQVMQLIDEAITSRPKNYHFAQLAVDYHFGEAAYEDDQNDWAQIKTYFKNHPDRREQLIKATKPMLVEDAPDPLKGYALSVWAMAQDREMIQKILLEYPNVIDDLTEANCHRNRVGYSRYQVLYHMVGLGQWKKLCKVLPVIRKEDEEYRKIEGKEYCVADTSGWDAFEAYEALAIAMDGDFDEGIELLEKMSPHPTRFLYLLYIRAHYACLTRKDFEDLEAFAKYYTDDPDPNYIRALYYLKKKDDGYAMKELEEAKKLTGTPWVSLKNEVLEFLERHPEVEGAK